MFIVSGERDSVGSEVEAAEAHWLARIAQGDHAALRTLYDSYRPQLRRYLWRLLAGDGDAVEDCLQETFITLWRSAATFRGEGRVAAWVFRIASRAAAHARRADASRPTQPLPDDVGNEDPLGASTPETEVLNRMMLSTALATLSPKHRVTLELVFVHGFTMEETAQILTIPVGTVKSRLNYARRALAQALVADGS